MVNLTQRFNEKLCPQTIKISQRITSMYQLSEINCEFLKYELYTVNENVFNFVTMETHIHRNICVSADLNNP